MGVEKGSAFLLKVGDGNIPATYATVAGMRTTQLSVNGEAVNITSKDSGGWRELLSGAGGAIGQRVGGGAVHRIGGGGGNPQPCAVRHDRGL